MTSFFEIDRGMIDLVKTADRLSSARTPVCIGGQFSYSSDVIMNRYTTAVSFSGMILSIGRLEDWQ